MVARALGVLAVERDAAFAEDALRSVVDETQWMDAGAFRRDDVGSVVTRERFGPLATHAISHAHEKNFYRIGHGLRRVVCHAQEIFVDGRVAAQLGMKRGGENFSLAHE